MDNNLLRPALEVLIQEHDNLKRARHERDPKAVKEARNTIQKHETNVSELLQGRALKDSPGFKYDPAKLQQALGITKQHPDIDASPQLQELFDGSILNPVSDWAKASEPSPVIWRDKETKWADPVLSVGEVALLTGAGGLGKSYLTLELAAAATAQHDRKGNKEYGAACGLRVRRGSVVLVSYEDSPSRIAHRLKGITGGSFPENLYLWEDPWPLWVAITDRQSGTGPCSDWRRLWDKIQELQASLVIIDPASAALADVSTSETGPVRAFLRELALEAKNATTGVLIVAHSTKAARNAAKQGEDPGAGIVAGSAAWYDGARGILSLTHDPKGTDDPDQRLLTCIKANYGRTGWTARLTERLDQKRFCGLKLVNDEFAPGVA